MYLQSDTCYGEFCSIQIAVEDIDMQTQIYEESTSEIFWAKKRLVKRLMRGRM